MSAPAFTPGPWHFLDVGEVVTSDARRTLKQVLSELAASRRQWRDALGRAERADRHNDPRAETHWGDRMSEADKLTDQLRDEAIVMIEAATGCSWDLIEGAGL